MVATTTPNKKGQQQQQQQQQDNGTSSSASSSSSTVQVVVRLRPLNEREKKHGTLPVITASTNDKTVTVIKGVGSRQVRSIYKFNNVFTSFSTQEEIFDSTLKPIINDVVYLGYESTVFAYGQTGTGKTYTMEGELTTTTTIVGSEKTNNNNGIIGTGGGGATTKTTTSPPDDDDSLHGVIPRSANAIFNELEQDENCLSYNVSCSFLEIYNEELCDLLAVSSTTSTTTTSAESGGGGSGTNTPTTPTTSDRNPYGYVYMDDC